MVIGTRDFNNVSTSSPSQTLSVVSDPSQGLDSADGGHGNTEYQNDDWKTYNGFYRTYPEVKAAVDKYALWTVGKGFKADAATTKKLGSIKGFGKDSFNSIMRNMLVIKLVNGDSYAEIIKDTRGRLINLKPLNPGNMKIVAGANGLIKYYEQTSNNKNQTPKKFKVDQILHLTHNREGDEIHGVSIFEALSRNLKNVRQLDNDMGKVFHRYVMPMLKWKLNTDKPAEIAKIKSKADEAQNEGRNMFMPNGAMEVDPLMIPQFSTLNPLDWRREWIREGIKSVGVPELILGSATDETEASSKIVYLGWQQTIEDGQLYVEEQLEMQMNIKVEYEFPARIEENLGEDESKDGSMTEKKKSETKVTTASEEGANAGNGGIPKK